MITELPPGVLMICGAILVALVPRMAQAWAVLALATISLVSFWMLPAEGLAGWSMFGETVGVVRLDEMSRLFGIVFHIAAILCAIYALHVRDTVQHIAGLAYAGAAIGAACAGDMVSLFVYWELTAVTSVFLIWANQNDASFRAGMRYLIIQVGSGVLLLSGAIIRYVEQGTLAFDRLFEEGQPLSLAAVLILLSFGIKAAFPLLHNWLQDSYPKATATGTVFLSGFTTKLAIYALARGFAGYEPLIWIGCVMTLFPIVFAVIENDLRRVLAYSLNNQLGFMVVGIGIGTPLALNGTFAHAFCHIIYKALLFMSMGAVLHRVGTTKATELGGLHRSMPLTTIFCMIGAGAISGFPLLSGFISKSMIITAAAEEHMFWVWIVLLIASAGVMEHSGIKIPFFAFFAHDAGHRVKEAPWNMLVAMGIAAALCVGLGVFYTPLYGLLPFAAEYHPYTVTHVVTQLQLLLFAMLAFVFLMKTGLYPEERRATVLDTDWVYRRLLPATGRQLAVGWSHVRPLLASLRGHLWQTTWRGAEQTFGVQGTFGRTWSTSVMAFWATVILAGCLLLYYGRQ